ncbi:hypothetical protein SAMN04488543_1859 [Friedmanniella luteola]|uniref:Uncharacterized protein n=1 Tax=Friedmanniella luteola TaxID=546871 RepID=A0A1H1SRS2_9ACTN|nr:hypothetical protein [Friedmanniella luteola]SDS50717.1 hypothetical protein SAMN04488543_1859 [Friedmanniella luteola]
MHPDPLVTAPGWDQDRSRRASERYLLLAAVAEQRRTAPRRPGPVRRLRHGLAGGLVATARLIDAT